MKVCAYSLVLLLFPSVAGSDSFFHSKLGLISWWTLSLTQDPDHRIFSVLLFLVQFSLQVKLLTILTLAHHTLWCSIQFQLTFRGHQPNPVPAMKLGQVPESKKHYFSLFFPVFMLGRGWQLELAQSAISLGHSCSPYALTWFSQYHPPPLWEFLGHRFPGISRDVKKVCMM